MSIMLSSLSYHKACVYYLFLGNIVHYKIKDFIGCVSANNNFYLSELFFLDYKIIVHCFLGRCPLLIGLFLLCLPSVIMKIALVRPLHILILLTNGSNCSVTSLFVVNPSNFKPFIYFSYF